MGDGESDVHPTYSKQDDTLFEGISMTISILSTLGSLFVVATSLIFYKQLTSRKLFMKLIALISASNLISTTSLCFGYPQLESSCRAQSILWTFGSRLTWTFATATSYELLHYLKHGNFALNLPGVVICAVVVNIGIGFLPLAFNVNYGLPPAFLGTSYCKVNMIHAHSQYEECDVCTTVMLLILYGPCAICVILMLICAILLRDIVKKHSHYLDEVANNYNNRIIRQVIVYPIGTMVFWLPLFVYFLYAYFMYDAQIQGLDSTQHNIFNAFNAFVSFEGLYIAGAFVYGSKEARVRWWLFFVGEKETQNSRLSHEQRSSIASAFDDLTLTPSFQPDFLTDEELAQYASRMKSSASISSERYISQSSGSDIDVIPDSDNEGNSRGLSFHLSKRAINTTENFELTSRNPINEERHLETVEEN